MSLFPHSLAPRLLLRRVFPQPVKPAPFALPGGTTEVVPLPEFQGKSKRRKGTTVKQQEKKEADAQSPALRGYCRVCNRYYFFKNGVDTGSIQLHQYHTGVCQDSGYVCARIAVGHPG
jgi:hypothetical protein